MRGDRPTDRDSRRVRALALLGGLTLEAVVFGLLMAASPTVTQTGDSSLRAEATCEALQAVSEPAA